jgi:hypothetical protein
VASHGLCHLRSYDHRTTTEEAEMKQAATGLRSGASLLGYDDRTDAEKAEMKRVGGGAAIRSEPLGEYARRELGVLRRSHRRRPVHAEGRRL